MSAFLQYLVLGLLVGGVYALVASGLSLVFGVMKIINIAHGAFLILGAFLGVYITLAVQQGSADVWRDNFIAGAAADAARETVDGRPSLVNPDRNDPPPAQQP